MTEIPEIENHPLEPFLPPRAQILILGSFPPQKKRWCMDFFYPNWINDMWRIMGLAFFNNSEEFIITGKKTFDKEKIISFLNKYGIALYDTACAVRRLKENASDKYLEVIRQTDLSLLLLQIPHCHTIVTTGEKATETICNYFNIQHGPKVGEYISFTYKDRNLRLFRMPSSSRAYPMKLEDKTLYYKKMMQQSGIF